MTSTPLLPDLIVAQADRTPDATAVQQWERRLRYGELVGAASLLAVRLQEIGVGPEVRVGICHRRSPRLPVAVLGVLLAGGAYVPLDPEHPRRRLEGTVADAGLAAVVADEDGRARLRGLVPRLVDVPAGGALLPPPPSAAPSNAAYVLYTSGSTGRPKGVVVSHAAVAAFAVAARATFDLGVGSRAAAFAALGFDVSVLDLLLPLTRGAAVQLVPDEDRIDAARLQRFLEAHEVTWGFLPPALLPLVDPGRLPWLRDLVTAGEPPGPEQVARWSDPPRRFHNWYGPTETTVCVVGTELTGSWSRPVPIGVALPGTVAHVLDEHLRPCPLGVAGELCIGGAQVARGYLGRPGLTAQRFVPDPFAEVGGSRLYRTGDRVVRDPDGGLRFLGRIDRQVKIHGQRVEAGEVEAALRGHPGVLQAVVDVVALAPGGAELVAYVTPATAPDHAGIRAHLAERLPSAMLPARTVRLPVLPLNAAGKVDLPALRAAGTPAAAPPADAGPADAAAGLEGRVTATWHRVMGGPAPSPATDFLVAGGDSLRAMRLAAALRADVGREVAVADVLAGRTPRGIAARVAVAPRPQGADTVTTGSRPALSSAQHRLWFVEQLVPGTPAHNIAMAQRLRGPLDVGALRAALAGVVARHEALRWRVLSVGGTPVVAVRRPGDPLGEVEDLTAGSATAHGGRLAELLDAEARTPFDLAADPLLRVRLLRLGTEHHVLAVTVHHLVFDGWSQEVLFRDLSRAYADAVAGVSPAAREQPVRFADYVADVGDRARRAVAAGLPWWRDHLGPAPPAVELPLDRERPAVQTLAGRRAAARVGDATGAAVLALAGRLGVTPAVVLLAAFAQLLRRLTGQHDLVVGTPHADRPHEAFAPLVGLCLQILPLRLRVDDDAAFEDHVRACDEELREAAAHGDVPLERIVEALGVPRDPSRSALVQVLFNAHDFGALRLDLQGCTADPLRPGLAGSLFDLTLHVAQRGVGVGVGVEVVANRDLYGEDTVRALVASYLRLLDDLVARPAAAAGTASSRALGTGLPDPGAPLPVWAGPGVLERVERAAARHADRVAVSGVGGTLTHREVGASRRRVAGSVTAAGIVPGAVVAVLAARHVALPALLLGVLGAGARWAVLDPALPPAVLAQQAAAAGAVAVLPCPGVVVPPELDHLPRLDPAGAAPSGDVAPAAARGYVAFTSGTSGEPAAVATGERPLAHFLDWYTTVYRLGPGDRVALLSGLAHDPLLRDVLIPLVTGGRLVVPDQAWIRDPAALLAWLRSEQVTVAHLTPQLGRLLASVPRSGPLPALRLLGLGGDRLRYGDAEALRALAPHALLLNLYGTTETPQAHGVHEVRETPAAAGSLPVPVGHGIPGSQLLVLGPDGRPAGVGEQGEVVVRSRHLSEGYLDRELTARRFGPAPSPSGPDDRVYRTGDLGRHRPDGALVVLGRRDEQVKVRGFRVELAEVEAALAAHPGVRATVAVADRAPDGQTRLRAYVVPEDPGVRPAELRAHLRGRLPDHAVPDGPVLIAAVPLTPNGKVDRAALPRPSLRPPDPSASPLATPTEHAVAEIWRGIVGHGRLGAHDNFFDVGGNSLAVVAVQARLAARLHREVSVVDLFRLPTIRSLARHLDGSAGDPGLDAAARRAATRRDRRRRPPPDRSGGAVHQRGRA